MRIFTSSIAIALLTCTQLYAGGALSAPRVAKHSKRAARSASAEDVESSKVTSIRSLGVTVFTVQKADGDITAAQAASLTDQVVQELNQKSFLRAVVQPGSGMGKASREKLLSDIAPLNMDAVVVGMMNASGVSFWIVSKNGARLAANKVERRLRMLNDAAVKELASAVVDEIVRAVPYRGFLTEETADGVFTLNLGADHGISKGQKLRVFDFSGPSLTANKVDRGEVEVIEVSAFTSKVEVTSNNSQVRPYQKVGFDERARGMVVETQTPTRGFALIGGEMISVSGTSDPDFADRAYNMSATPGLVLGLGWNKTSVRTVFAQAQNDSVDLVFAEVVGLYRLYDRTTGYNRYQISGGARVALFSVSTKSNVVTPLESSTSIAPAVDARLIRAVGGPVHVFAAGNIYYPIYNTGNSSSSSIAFSYGAGGEVGALVDFTPRLSLEFGGRFHLIRRPVEGQSAVQERYTQVFADVIARF